NGVTLGNTISGAGQLGQIGTGTTTITAANSYSGGTVLNAGTLAVANANALGTGTLREQGTAKLLGTITETLTNRLVPVSPASTFTIAAAHGTALTLDGSAGWTLDFGVALAFGALGQDGVVVWHTPAGSSGAPGAIVVQAGTLKAGDSGFSSL